MGEMADYYDDQGEELEEMPRDVDNEGNELRLFIVTYNNGNFHSSTNNIDIAWETARRIGGIIGELTNVHRPKYLEEVLPPELYASVADFLEGRASEMPKAA